jgi:hypothetical protein
MSTVFVDRQSTYPNRCRITPLDGNPYYAVVERADEPIVVGTPLNAETLNGMVDEITSKFHIESTDSPGCYYRMVDGDVEWINPPMFTGVEYRTTERHDGKVVYTKRLRFTLDHPGNYSCKEVIVVSRQPYVLDVKCSILDAEHEHIYYPPFFDSDKYSDGLMAYYYVKIEAVSESETAVSLLCRTRTAALMGGTATFDIKYTK